MHFARKFSSSMGFQRIVFTQGGFCGNQATAESKKWFYEAGVRTGVGANPVNFNVVGTGDLWLKYPNKQANRNFRFFVVPKIYMELAPNSAHIKVQWTEYLKICNQPNKFTSVHEMTAVACWTFRQAMEPVLVIGCLRSAILSLQQQVISLSSLALAVTRAFLL